MIDIRESIKKIFLAKSDNKLVEDFARIQYHEKFKNIKKQSGTFHRFQKIQLKFITYLVLESTNIMIHLKLRLNKYEL